MLMQNTESIIVMFICSVLAGFISGMNLFVDKKSDIRLNINDLYMAITMTGFMFIFLGIYYKSQQNLLIGFITTLVGFTCIRKQLFVGKKTFINSMIPHHSMAIMMTKRLKDKNVVENSNMKSLLDNIIETQTKEIEDMKSFY